MSLCLAVVPTIRHMTHGQWTHWDDTNMSLCLAVASTIRHMTHGQWTHWADTNMSLCLAVESTIRHMTHATCWREPPMRRRSFLDIHC